MKKREVHSKNRGLWILLFSAILILLYTFWWMIFIYEPYSRKRVPLADEIFRLQEEIKSDQERVAAAQKVEERLRSSKSRLHTIRSGLPRIENLDKYIDHLKNKGRELKLPIDEAIPDSHPLPIADSVDFLIYPVSVSLKIKGNFISIGKYIQSLEEEDWHFCHVKGITIERASTGESDVLAMITLEVFFYKEGEGMHEFL